MKPSLLITTFEKEATATESGGKSGKSSASSNCVSKEHGDRPALTATEVLAGIVTLSSSLTAQETPSVKLEA